MSHGPESIGLYREFFDYRKKYAGNLPNICLAQISRSKQIDQGHYHSMLRESPQYKFMILIDTWHHCQPYNGFPLN